MEKIFFQFVQEGCGVTTSMDALPYGYVWFPKNAKERKKKIMWKIIFFSLGDMENMMEKKYKGKY